jgi:hypothetical protein
VWELGLDGDAIRASLGLLDPGLSPVSTSIRLAKRIDANQSSGTLHDLLSDYLFQNATVTIWLWEASLTDFADALQIFKGNVSRPAAVTLTGMTLHLLQDLSWNQQTPPKVVDKVNYPDSPDGSQGVAIPLVYGNHIAAPMRTPWTSSYGGKQYQEDSGGGAGVVPGVIVDAGVGSAAVKVVYAGHECMDLLDRANGFSQFVVGDNVLAPLDTTGITETLGSTESYLSIADENTIAYVAILPMDVRTSSGAGHINTATNPRNAMDPFDETTFASLNQTTGKNELQLILPTSGPLGRIESVMAYVAFAGDAANTQNLRVNAYTPGVGAGGFAPASWVSTGTTPGIAAVTWPTNYWTQDWDFGGNATIYDLRVDFVGAVANNKASIYWVALVVKYRPSRSVVTPGKRVVSGRSPRGYGKFTQPPPVTVFGQGQSGTKWLYKNAYTDIAATYQLDAQFLGNIKGQPDDGSGTFTGSAAALIERPSDIANHFLQTYAGVASSDIETGSSTTGSFVLARSVLRNGSPNDLKLAAWIGDRTTVQRVLQGLCEQSGMCIYQDRFTDKWLCHVWKPGAAADYDRALSWDGNDFMSFECEETSVVDVRTAIRVKYGYDHFKNRTAYETWVNSGGSGQGLNLPTIRDQRLVVTAGSNDDFDWTVGASTYATTITAGTYTDPMAICSDLRGKIRTAMALNQMTMGYGFSIKTGYNDLLDWTVGGTPYQCTLDQSEYTAEGLAAHVGVQMTANGPSGTVYTCTYTHSTNKFSVTASTGTLAVDGADTAAGWATSAAHVLGFYQAVAPAATVTGGVARYGKRFWFLTSAVGGATTSFNIKWSSGASASTNCAYLLGYARTDSGVTADNPAAYSRGVRESLASTFEGYYGPREERQITAEWIRDENTAVELRDRIFDLTAKPRVVAKFASMRTPDLRRMQVIEFSSDLDTHVAYPKYGSNGSWAGKRFRVLEVEQDFTQTFHTEVLAIEAD